MFEFFETTKSSTRNLSGMVINISDSKGHMVMKIARELLHKIDVRQKDKIQIGYCKDKDMFAIIKSGDVGFLLSQGNSSVGITSPRQCPQELRKALELPERVRASISFSFIEHIQNGSQNMLTFKRI